MKTALEKILEYKVKDGRITSQSDKEQWTCLQKIIAINKLIVDYHNAFVELRESYQDLLDRYNVINAEWDVLKTDMEAIATEWTQFKPLVNQIINLWENTITPTFEEWTTLMNNWGNTMNGYASTMADYEQQMNNIQQEFNNIETEWGNITLAVKGNFEFITEAVPASESTTLTVNLTEFNEMYIVGTQDDKIDVSLLIGEVMISAYNGIALKKTSYVGFKYIGDIDNGNQLYRMYGAPITSEYFSITDSNDTTATFTITNKTNTTRIYAILRRHIPYFSADQSSEVQEALTKSNEALTKATTVDETVVGLSGTVSELQNRAFGLVLHDFNMTPIATNQTLTNTNNSRQAWSHIVIMWNADASTNPVITSLYIPVLAIPTTGTRQFASSDDKYSVAEIGWNNSGLTIKNIPTSSQNAIRFVGLF